MRQRWPGWAQAGAAFGLGAVMASGQAPLALWWLALPGLAALVALIARAKGWRQAAWLGLFGGAGHFALALSWIVEPFFVDAARHGWMAPFAVVFMSFGLALFWAAAAALGHRLGPPRWRPVALAVALTAAELARGHVLTGFPWAMIGHIWIGTPPAQLAAWVGPGGLTLFTLLAAALPVALRGPGLAASAAMLAAAFAIGLWRLDQPDPAPRGLTVRLVQPNAEQELKWDPDRARLYFDRQLGFSAAPGAPDLVVWPETAVPYLLDRTPELAPLLAEAAQGATVAFGVQRTEGLRGWNSLAVVTPDARIAAVYDKHHLVPFGEYIPFGDLAADLFGISAFAAQTGHAYSAGPGPVVLDLGPRIGRVLPLICYEAVFPQNLRVGARPDWLLQVTNDAWFGTLTGPYQHLAQSRLRAIEQGLPMIRVANTGVSAVIDAKGRVLSQLPLGEAGWLDAPLPPALPVTVYARQGEAPVLALLGLLTALLALSARRDARA